MYRNFKFNPAEAPDPIYFETIHAEKPGGGMLANPDYDVPKSVAVGKNASGLFAPIKAYRVVEAATSDATTLKIAKGSGVQEGDVLATGKIGVACTDVNTTTSEDYDVVTVSLGVAIAAGTVLFQAAAASVEAGYYDAESTGEGALKVVASGATTGQINLADVTPYKGSKNLAANNYVVKKEQADAAPKYTPTFILGTCVPAGEGDKEVRLINGANLRKETANVATEVVALMKGIELV